MRLRISALAHKFVCVYIPVMSEMAHIRRDVFQVTQRAFAQIAGATQGTVSRWEAGEFEPSREQLSRIRDEALRRGIKWNDAWFFEAPVIASVVEERAS